MSIKEYTCFLYRAGLYLDSKTLYSEPKQLIHFIVSMCAFSALPRQNSCSAEERCLNISGEQIRVRSGHEHETCSVFLRLTVRNRRGEEIRRNPFKYFGHCQSMRFCTRRRAGFDRLSAAQVF